MSTQVYIPKQIVGDLINVIGDLLSLVPASDESTASISKATTTVEAACKYVLPQQEPSTFGNHEGQFFVDPSRSQFL